MTDVTTVSAKIVTTTHLQSTSKTAPGKRGKKPIQKLITAYSPFKSTIMWGKYKNMNYKIKEVILKINQITKVTFGRQTQ